MTGFVGKAQQSMLLMLAPVLSRAHLQPIKHYNSEPTHVCICKGVAS